MARTSPELAQLLTDFSDELNGGDADAALRRLAFDDLVVIGTDHDEWLEDVDEIRDVLLQQAGQASIQFEHVVAREEEDSGWVAARGSATLSSGQILSIRWTAVARRGREGWLIVHSHLSVPRGTRPAPDRPEYRYQR